MAGRRVVIVGGGAGGAVLANLLQPHGFEVTVIDRNIYTFFQPGNLWIAFKGVSPEKFRRPIPSVLKRGVKFVNDEVVSVDLNERKVVTKNSGSFSYDIVVLASGAELDYNLIPGHRELLERFGDFYSTQENAQKLWNTLQGLKEGRFVIGIAEPVYKCPPGPHKGAFFASELFRSRGLADKVKVVLAVPVPHAYPAKTIADIIEPEFIKRGVEIHKQFTVNQIDLQNKKLVSVEGEEVKFDVAVVIPPHRGPRYSISPAEVRDNSGFIKIDKYTSEIQGFDDAYAIGDCTNAPTSKSGATAHLQAGVVAARLLGYDARYNGRINCPIINDGQTLFVIGDYDHPPVPARFSTFKRLMEDVFVATYWGSVKYPELWDPIFKAYLEASNEFIRRGERW